MRQILAKMTIVAAIVALTACSTNTREQNTVLGAGTGAVAGGLVGSLATGAGSGWVIAAGAVAGALIGGMVGNSMDSTDTRHMYVVMDKYPINRPASWVNNRTHTWYKIVPTSNVMAYHDYTYCRHYSAYGRYHGKTTVTRGIACRMSDGMWRQVR